MRRSFFLLFILLISLIVPVQAQSTVAFDTIQIKIWPEYDRNAVLVIQDLFLAESIDLPAQVTLQIPAAVGDPYSVAVRELDGMLYLLEYEKETNGNWLNLTFTTAYPEIWIEYYDPSIAVNGDVHSYSYQWTGNYAVNSMQIEVQQPYSATQMVFKQSMGSSVIGGDGLTYYTSNVGAVNFGTAFTLDFSYVKTDDVLSSQMISQQQVTAAQPITEETKGRLAFNQIFPWILVGLSLVIITIGVFWYIQNQKKETTPAYKRHSSHRANKYDYGSGNSIFCHQCGNKANPSDSFCRSCGTQLRRNDE